MILLIGTKNCSRCKITKDILDKKGLEYTYKLITELTNEEQSECMQKAKEKNILSFPLIIKNDNIITLQEVD